jgi:SAM-dependent methyltransferase
MSSATSPLAQDAGLSEGCDGCGEHAATEILRTGDRRFGVPGDFAVVRCAGCGLVRTTPQPADPAAYYPGDEYYSYQPPAPPTARVRARVRSAYAQDQGDTRMQRALARVARDRLMPGLPPGPPGRILDVGCGSGGFLLALREAGWSCEGVEVDGQAVAAAHTAGLLDVREGDLTAVDLLVGSYDVVRFWHVLEHVRSPAEQLRAARRLLRPGGTLLIGVPNARSLLARTAGDAWYYLDVPRHLWHFDRSSLARTVEGAGFAVEGCRLTSTPTALVGTLGYATGRGERLIDRRDIWYGLLPFAALLDRAGLGDAIVLTATPRSTAN